jgi:SsrA-binding protein
MILVQNRKARSQYAITKEYLAGIELLGPEVKSLRLKHASLTGSHVALVGGQALLLNAQINPYSFANNVEYEANRTRKLLLKKTEIDSLTTAAAQKGWSVIPLSIEKHGRYVKVRIALAKGLQQHEKRQRMKERDLQRKLRSGEYDR